MALVCVEALSEGARERAFELSERWRVPLAEKFTGNQGVKAVVSDLYVGLGFVEDKRGKPYYVDFQVQEWKARFAKGLPRNHIFRRALGAKDKPLSVIDATAGFGQDAMLAVCLGCEVTAIEKSPVVVEVLRDGLERAMREDESARSRFGSLNLVEADAEAHLLKADPADVIYLDPMFNKPKKSAKSPKEMQLLQDLLAPLPEPEELERLFKVAFERAKSRVVVKQPLKGKALGRTPTHSFKGQSIRYDVYVKS